MNAQFVKCLVVSTVCLYILVSQSPAHSQEIHCSDSTARHHTYDGVLHDIDSICSTLDVAKIWHFNESDLLPHSDIHWNANHDNEMRYAIHCRPGPVSIRLYINAGLRTEGTETEEGISDLLTKYFRHTHREAPWNTTAYTDFDGSVYSIDLPEGNDLLIDEALKALSSHLQGAILDEENLHDLKKALVQSYAIQPPSIDDQRRAFLFSGSQLAHKNNLNDYTPDPETLERFVKHWYTPDRAVLIIVGDTSYEEIAPKIERYFSRPQLPPIKYPTPAILGPEHTDMDAYAVLDTEANFARIIFETLERSPNSKDSRATRKQKLLGELEELLLQKRFSEISSTTHEIDNTCVHFYTRYNSFNIRKIEITTSPQDWEKAVEVVVDQLVRIVYKGGFNEIEFDEARNALREKYRLQEERSTLITNRECADSHIQRLQEEGIITHPRDDYDFIEEVLREFSVQECNEEFYRIWQTQQCYLIAEGNILLENQSEAIDALTQSYLEAAFSAVRKHKGGVSIPDRFTTRPTSNPYPIAKTNIYEHLGLAQIRYENNLRLNIANNYSDPEKILVAVRFGMGKLSEDLQRPGLGYLAEHIFLESGLAGFDPTTIKTLEETLDIKLKFEIEEDAFLIRSECPPEYFSVLIKLLFAYATEPRMSPKAFESAKENYIRNYNTAMTSPEGFLKLNGNYHIFHPGNIFESPDPETIKKRTLQELKTWISPVIHESVFEISIVGAFEANDIPYITETIDQTFATLSPRILENKAISSIRISDEDEQNKHLVFNHQGTSTRWGTHIAWPTCDGWSKLETRRLRILTEILGNRVRRSLSLLSGKQKSPTTVSLNSLAYHNLGCIQTTAFNDVQHAEKTKALILNEAQKIAEASQTTFQEFRGRIKPLLDDFKVFSPATTGISAPKAIRELIIQKMKFIAECAMNTINTSNLSYEELKKTLTSQVGNMKTAAHYRAALPHGKNSLENDIDELRASLIEFIKEINPNDLTQQEIENLTIPTINSIIKTEAQIASITGMQAQANLRDWFINKTMLAIESIRSVAEQNGIDYTTLPDSLISTIEDIKIASSSLPIGGVQNFYSQFETTSLEQSKKIGQLIKLIEVHFIDTYKDITPKLEFYKEEFQQMAQNLKFQKSTIKNQRKIIEKKVASLVDNAWELTPLTPNKEYIDKKIRSLVDQLSGKTKTLQEHQDIEDLLDNAIEKTILDAWNALNPNHITSQELQEALEKLNAYLNSKSNTPQYWMNNVLIGSQFYPQKLDWAPSLVSDYMDVSLDDICRVASNYLHKDRAYIIEVFPENYSR